MYAYIFTYIDICIPYIYFSKMSPFCQAFRLFVTRGPFKMRSVTSSKCLAKAQVVSRRTLSSVVIEATRQLCTRHVLINTGGATHVAWDKM